VTVGKTLLTVEHDMGVVFGLADKIAVVVYGEVLAFDTPEAVRANARVQEAWRHYHAGDFGKAIETGWKTICTCMSLGGTCSPGHSSIFKWGEMLRKSM